MPEVFLVNPPRKRKRRKTTTKKKRVVTRAKKRTTTKRRRPTVRAYAAPRRRPTRRRATVKAKGTTTMAKRKRQTKKRRYTRNPAPKRRYIRRAASRVRGTFAGLNVKGALMNTPYYVLGMLGSKWVAKRFGGGASQTDPESWTWRSYLQMGLGAVATAYVVNLARRGSGQKVLEGGLALMVYELVQNELVAGSEWASAQFGADDYSYMPGDVETTPDGRTAMLGDDYQWRALPEANVSSSLEPVGPLGQLEPVGPLGTTDPYRSAILG